MEQEQASRQISAQNPPTSSSRASSPQISPQNATTNGIQVHVAETETEEETSNIKATLPGDANPAPETNPDLGNALTNPSPYTNLSVHSLTHEMVFGPIPDREYHEGFMRKAIEMAQLALDSDETPVGCVFVRDGEVIGRGINGTNASLNVSTELFFFWFFDGGGGMVFRGRRVDGGFGVWFFDRKTTRLFSTFFGAALCQEA
jgi:hypothetical protein